MLLLVVWFVGRDWLFSGSGRRHCEVVEEWWAPCLRLPCCWLLSYLWSPGWYFDTCDYLADTVIPVITLLILWYLWLSCWCFDTCDYVADCFDTCDYFPDCSDTCDYVADTLIPVITLLMFWHLWLCCWYCDTCDHLADTLIPVIMLLILWYLWLSCWYFHNCDYVADCFATCDYFPDCSATCDVCCWLLWHLCAMSLTGNVFEKAYDLPSHVRNSSFFVAVCLKVIHNSQLDDLLTEVSSIIGQKLCACLCLTRVLHFAFLSPSGGLRCNVWYLSFARRKAHSGFPIVLIEPFLLRVMAEALSKNQLKVGVLERMGSVWNCVGTAALSCSKQMNLYSALL